MNPVKRLFLAAALLLALFAVAPAPAGAEKRLGQREIEDQLTCQCGCGLTVAACNHLECGFAIPARKRIAEGLAQGLSAEQIVDGFKKEYGEKVLSSPVPEGFNILAWIAPYLTIAVAGVLMFLFFRHKAARATEVTDAAPPGVPGIRSDERLERLRRDLEDLDR